MTSPGERAAGMSENFPAGLVAQLSANIVNKDR